MGEMSYEDAVAALEGTGTAAESAPTPESAAPQTSPQGVDAGTTAPTQAQPVTPDSFTNVDPSQLSPQEQTRYREMQADYTRKTQEIAQQRQQFEAIGDPERAYQAIQFVDALENDPNFVVQVHQQLSEALQAAGMSPAQADQAAAQELQSNMQGQGTYEEDGSDSQLAKEVAELREWRNEQELRETERMLAGQIQQAEMFIRQNHPEYTDQDIESVYERAFAYGGDLIQAETAYANERQRIIESWTSSKGSVTDTTARGATGGHVETAPEGFDPTDLDQQHTAAQEFLRNSLAGS